jgi:hypothetical protein
MYLHVGGLISNRVYGNNTVLVEAPGTRRVTPTYAGQVFQEDKAGLAKVVVTLGNSAIIARQIAPTLWATVQNDLETQISEVKKDCQAIDSDLRSLSRPKRARIFWDFADRNNISLYQIRDSINEGVLNTDQINSLTKEVYGILKRNWGMASAVKDGIRTYICNGEIDDSLNSFFTFAAKSNDPALNSFGTAFNYSRKIKLEETLKILSEQLNKVKLRQGTFMTSDTDGLVQAISRIKRGEDGKVTLLDAELDVQKLLNKMLSSKNGVYFLAGVDNVSSDCNDKFTLFPVNFKLPECTNLPASLRESYISTPKIYASVQVLEDALAIILLTYIQLAESRNKFLSVPLGLVMRRIMPENPIIDLCMPQNEVSYVAENGERIPAPPELAEAIANRANVNFANGQMAFLVANFLGLKDKLTAEGLKNLVSTLNKIEPILPRSLYEMTRLENEVEMRNLVLDDLIKTPFKFESRGEKIIAEERLMLSKIREIKTQLKRDFGFEPIPDYMPYVEETIGLFKEDFGFIRNVLTRGADTPIA